jgi:hypothetical protein
MTPSGTTNSNLVPALMTSPVFANRPKAGSTPGDLDVWRAAALLLVGKATTPRTCSKLVGGGS